MDQEIRELHSEIWKHYPPSRGSYGRSDETRTLTTEELHKIFAYAKANVCEVHNACMGFGIGLRVYTQTNVPGMDLEHAITITNKHISEDAHFEDGWQMFHPVVSTEENRRRMKYHGLEPLKSKGFYDY